MGFLFFFFPNKSEKKSSPIQSYSSCKYIHTNRITQKGKLSTSKAKLPIKLLYFSSSPNLRTLHHHTIVFSSSSQKSNHICLHPSMKMKDKRTKCNNNNNKRRKEKKKHHYLHCSRAPSSSIFYCFFLFIKLILVVWSTCSERNMRILFPKFMFLCHI